MRKKLVQAEQQEVKSNSDELEQLETQKSELEAQRDHLAYGTSDEINKFIKNVDTFIEMRETGKTKDEFKVFKESLDEYPNLSDVINDDGSIDDSKAIKLVDNANELKGIITQLEEKKQAISEVKSRPLPLPLKGSTLRFDERDLSNKDIRTTYFMDQGFPPPTPSVAPPAVQGICLHLLPDHLLNNR